MATWAESASAAPDLAAVAERLWPGVVRLGRGEEPTSRDQPTLSVAYLATTRRDGSPRLHPFCPVIAGGRLFAVIPRSSPKGWDLRRDPRCVVHAMPGPDDDELCIRARAREVPGTSEERETLVRTIEAGGVGGMIESVTHDPAFELDVEQVDVARWLDIGQPGTRAERRQWRDTHQT